MKTKTIQKAVLKKGEKYLILLRSKQARFYPEHWDFPGGNLEEKEHPLHGVEREVFEETGLKVKALKPVTAFDEYENNTRYHFITYSTTILSGEFQLSSEHTAFRWATKDEILSLQIEPFIAAYFKKNP
ncbi:NUDIX domain-containing protein [Candidatus Woesearchaeota archaeon]|nr:NUDIX domain-containing protein [Candidatus Woesearchaeota archaeon]